MAAEVAKDVPDDGADMRCEGGLGTGEALETRGVPVPYRLRIRSPRLKAAA